VGNRNKLIGGIVGAALVVVLIAGYLLFFRDSAPVAVDSVEAAEARQEAIAEAAVGRDDDVQTDATDNTEYTDEDDGPTALDTGQPDSNASVGSVTDGLWTVDTSIGTFDATCLTDVCGSSFAGFRINEELANFGAKTVVGRTPGVSGSLELVDTQVTGAEFIVDMSGLITDNNSRTGALRGENGGINTDVFPEARFELTQPIELGSVPAEGASIDVQAVGNLTVHGVTNEVTIPLTAEVQAGVIIVFGNLEGMLLADYDIPKPTAAVVVSVEDNATLELQLFFSR
jgi:polyisoprenoid-binding protein YceI